MTIPQYLNKYGSTMSSRVMHDCLICKTSVTRTKDLIQKHLKIRHEDMSITTYYNKYVLKVIGSANKSTVQQGQKDGPEPLRIKTENESPGGAKDAAPPNSPGNETVISLQSKSILSMMEWANKCIYSCKMCEDFSSTSRKKHSRHLFEQHDKMTVPNYLLKYGTTMSTRVRHNCLICQSSLTHTRDAIQQHLQRDHQNMKIDITSYYKDYVLKVFRTSTENKRPAQKVQDEPNPKRVKRESSLHRSETVAVKQEADVAEDLMEYQPTIPSSLAPNNENLRHFPAQAVKVETMPQVDRSDKTTIESQEQASAEPLCTGARSKIISAPAAARLAIWSKGPPAIWPKIEIQDVRSMVEESACNENASPLEMTASSSDIAAMEPVVIIPELQDSRVDAESMEENGAISTPGAPLEENDDVNAWMDGCRFSCRLCSVPIMLPNRPAFKIHIKQQHSVDELVYKNVVGNAMVEMSFFKCRLCQKVMHKDRYDVSLHLLNEHNTTAEVYRAMEIGLNN